MHVEKYTHLPVRIPVCLPACLPICQPPAALLQPKYLEHHQISPDRAAKRLSLVVRKLASRHIDPVCVTAVLGGNKAPMKIISKLSKIIRIC